MRPLVLAFVLSSVSIGALSGSIARHAPDLGRWMLVVSLLLVASAFFTVIYRGKR